MSVTLVAADVSWLDGVLADVRREGIPGVGTSAVVRLGLSRLQAEPVDKVVSELIQLREGGLDQ